MTYTNRDRDRGRLAVAAVTGVGAVGALTATGWLTGVAASDFAARQESEAGVGPTRGAQAATGTSGAARKSGLRARQSALRQRPYVTRVTLRYVTAARTTSVAPGPGGTLTGGGSGTSGSSGRSGSSSGPGPAPAPAPAPEPPPAPSSGS